MKIGHLVLQIITPDGQSLRITHVDAVVFRRRERRFELGSEIAIYPNHAPLLVRIPIAPLRYRRGDRMSYLALGGGFAEIRANQVLVMTPRFVAVQPEEPEPWAMAAQLTQQWRRERRDFQQEMVGYIM